MGKIKITPEKETTIIKMYEEGKSIKKDISPFVELSPSTIIRVLKKYNVELRGCFIKGEEAQKVIELYKNGLSEEEVRQKTGICRTTIRRIIRRNNEKTHDAGEMRRIYTLDQTYFNALDHQNKFYILGFFYADGNVSKSDNNIQIALQERDVHILEKMKEEFNSNRPLYFDNRNNRNEKHMNVWTLSIDSKIMRDDLIHWGVIPQKTHTLKYPTFIPDDMHSHFLRGVMDGDGCIHATYCRGRLTRAVDICGTYDFCIGAKQIIQKYVGISCSIIQFNSQRPNAYRIVISGINNTLSFLNWIYKDAEMYLFRKYKLYEDYYKNAI